jgi:hypothetical protein
LVLAYLRKGGTFAELAAGFGISTATGWRYINETVALLAARMFIVDGYQEIRRGSGTCLDRPASPENTTGE